MMSFSSFLHVMSACFQLYCILEWGSLRWCVNCHVSHQTSVIQLWQSFNITDHVSWTNLLTAGLASYADMSLLQIRSPSFLKSLWKRIKLDQFIWSQLRYKHRLIPRFGFNRITQLRQSQFRSLSDITLLCKCYILDRILHYDHLLVSWLLYIWVMSANCDSSLCSGLFSGVRSS